MSTFNIGLLLLLASLFSLPNIVPAYRHVPSRVTPTNADSINLSFKRLGTMATATETYLVKTTVEVSAWTEECIKAYKAFHQFFKTKNFSPSQFVKYNHAVANLDRGMQHMKRVNALLMTSAHFNQSWIAHFVAPDGSFKADKMMDIDVDHFSSYKVLGKKFADRAKIYQPIEEVTVSHAERDSGYWENFGHKIQSSFEENFLIKFFYGLAGQKTRQNFIDIEQSEDLEKLNTNAKQTRTDLLRLSKNILIISKDLAKNFQYQTITETIEFFLRLCP